MNSPGSRHVRLPFLDFTAMSVATGVIASLYGYSFGNGEQIPVILREIDSSYLPLDFFVNAFDRFGPRFYFTKLMAFLSQFAPLPAVYLVTLLLANATVAFVTCVAAWTFWGRSKFAALLACAAVMSLTTFGLGYKAPIVYSSVIPSGLAIPFVLASVFAGLRYRPVASAVAASLAMPLHPLFGLETGAIMWATQVVGSRLRPGAERPTARRLLAAALILVATALIWWWPYRAVPQVSVDQFVDILSFRAPHHYLPSAFQGIHYLQALCFFVAAGISWWRWKRSSDADRGSGEAALVLTAVVACLCVGGFVFVEIVPTRAWMTAQTFRLPFLLKWLGLVLMAGGVARALESSGADRERAHAMLIGILAPPAAALANIWILVSGRCSGRINRLAVSRGLGPVILLVVLILIVVDVSSRSVLLFAFFVLLVWLGRAASRRVFIAAALFSAVSFTAVSYVAHQLDLSSRGSGLIARLDPVLTLDDFGGDYSDISRAAKSNTPTDAILLTPPRGGWMRAVGERAIVVDFGCFPFEEPAMVEWRQRINDCYGNTDKAGWPAALELDRNFRSITSQQIRELQSKYGVTHAVVYADTQLELTVLYENPTYKLVSLGEAIDQRRP